MSEDQTHRGELGNCRSCNARVLWVETESGKKMPLDTEPERRFVVESGASPMKARLRNTYVSHFSTCKDAGKWRKGPSDV
jgi:hypothetical protein